MVDSAAPRRDVTPARGSASWRRGLDLLFVLTLMVYAASGRDAVPFHGDESTFLWMSRDLDAVLDGRVGTLAFDDATREPLAQGLRVLNGSLSPVAIGIARRAAGFTRAELNGPWVWVLPGRPASEQWHFNASAGRLPDPELLSVARLPAALATAASVALVFAIALATTRSRLGAFVAAGFYATTPALLLDGRRAMQEGIVLLATALVVWATLAMLRARKREGGIPPRQLAAFAVAAGLALAAKHSAAVVVAAAWLCAAGAPWLSGERPSREAALRHVAPLVGAGLFALALFTVLVPVWGSPARTVALAALGALAGSCGALGTRARLALRAAAIAGIAAAFVAQPGLLAQGAAAARHLVSERSALLREQSARVAHPLIERPVTLLREASGAAPRYFEDPAWADFPEIRRQIDVYAASPLTGRTGFLRWPGGVLLLGLAGVGAFTIARRSRDPESALLATWLALPALALLANPLPWPRYYLLLHAPLAVLAGRGAVALAARRAESA